MFAPLLVSGPIAAAYQAVTLLDDETLERHAPALTARFMAAQAGVAGIPEQPATSGFLAVRPAPGPKALRAALPRLLGALAVVLVDEVGGWEDPRLRCAAPLHCRRKGC